MFGFDVGCLWGTFFIVTFKVASVPCVFIKHEVFIIIMTKQMMYNSVFIDAFLFFCQ